MIPESEEVRAERRRRGVVEWSGLAEYGRDAKAWWNNLDLQDVYKLWLAAVLILAVCSGIGRAIQYFRKEEGKDA